MLNTNRLKILREIAARGSIAGAAEALWLTPSAVSQQMSALEREMGVALLERTPRSVKLTDAGTRLVEHAEVILADCEAAVADLAALDGVVSGILRVSAFTTAMQALVVPALAVLRDRYPRLTVLVDDLEPHEAMPALKSGRIDVAFSHEYSIQPAFSDPGIERHDLLREPMMLALPAAHPLAGKPARLADFAEEHWIVGREGTYCHDMVVRSCNACGFEATVEMQSNDFRVIAAAVAQGLGVALVPSIADLRALDGLSLNEVVEPKIERQVFAAVRAGSSGGPGVSAMLGALGDGGG
jgi:DNA-binding transcriptional LysR family regulator